MTATLAAGSAQNPSTNVFVVNLPAGSAAGDLVVITVGARWNYTGLPAGWTVADSNDGSFFNGRVIWKILTSGDVSTGSVTFNLGGVSNLAATAVRITGTSASPTVTVRSSQRWGGGGSALLAAQPSNSFSAATGSLMLYTGINDSSTAMTISRGTQAGSADTTTLIIAHSNSEILAAPLSSTTVTFNSGSSTSAYYVVIEISEPGTAASGTGSLSLSGSGAAKAPVTATGALALSASGNAGIGVAGSGALTLAGSGVIDFQPASGSGSLTLSGSGAAGIGVAGSGALTLAGTGTAVGATAASGTGSLALSAAGSATLAASGTASLTLGAIGTAFALFVTDLTNALNGRRRRARGTATVTRAAASPPPGRTFAKRYDKAIAYPMPDMIDGRAE